MAHAYLFHGPPGVGKDAMAIEMAMMLNCEAGGPGSCGSCASCKAILRLEHPSFHLVLPAPSRPKTMKEKNYLEIIRDRELQRITNPYREIDYSPEITQLPAIGIDRVREMKRGVALRNDRKGVRVFLVSQAHLMTQEASNSLLKLLEEPPERTVLFLTTSRVNQLLDTIVSRCQNLRFNRIREEAMVSALIERWGFNEERAAFFSRLSDGSIQTALMLAEEDYEERRGKALELLDAVLEKDIMAGMDGADLLVGRTDKVEMREVLTILHGWIRDAFHISVGNNENIMNADQSEKIQAFGKRWPRFEYENALETLGQAIDYLEKNVYIPLILYYLCSRLKQCIIN
jgi:DNA polymerase-3 subunit delta'